MSKKFQVTGICIPDKHYMVDISSKIENIISDYIDAGKYFTINRARQYGKTTLLYLLEEKLKDRNIVLSLSFEAADDYFTSPRNLALGLISDIGDRLLHQDVPEEVIKAWREPLIDDFPMKALGRKITALCSQCNKNVVLMIDEVDKSSDNQIFLSFLGLLRAKYLDQLKGRDVTFQSVVLAGVYDIKNLKLKLHPGNESKLNSPWNIADDFTVDLSFHVHDIEGMLSDYEADHQTGMDIHKMSRLIYEYTSGYPYMVSRICKLIDERIARSDAFPDQKSAWTPEGFQSAIRLFLKEPNTLFDDMVKKLNDYPELKSRIKDILFRGAKYTFEIDSTIINIGFMFGFLKDYNNNVVVANRIFETKLYNLFLSEEELAQGSQPESANLKNQFVTHGMLQMNLVMEKFLEYFEEIFGNRAEKFIEDEGRRIFLMFLRPIINGTGNYYVEAQTRDNTRTDVIVDYRGRRFIIEMKLWHGNEYNKRGEQQLFDYLDYYKQDTGYLLSFNFNKNKRTGIHEIVHNGKKIVETIV